jgi:hypothetical protein
LIEFLTEYVLESPTTMVFPKSFLSLPYEIRAKIYKEVFVGSQVHLDLAKGVAHDRFQSQEDPISVLEYDGPEEYNVLLVCSQVKNEATPILASSLRLTLRHNLDLHRRFSIDFFQLERDDKAPAFLRQAIPSIRCIRFVSTYASRLKSDLRAFPRLQQLQINGQIESYGPFNDTEVNRDPLVLLEQAHDNVFLEGMIKGLKNYTTVACGSYLDTALDNSRPYTTAWKGEVAFKRPRTLIEVGPTRITVAGISEFYSGHLLILLQHFEIDLARKILLGKRFSLGEGYKIFDDPQQFFREHKEPSRDCPRLSRQEEELLSDSWSWRC